MVAFAVDDDDDDGAEESFFGSVGSTFGEVGGADEDDEADDEADESDDEFVDEVVDETFLAVSAALFLTIRFIDDTEGRLSSSQIPSDCN